MRIYITHCSAKKDHLLKHTGKEVTPEKLYTATPTQRFMNKCKEKGAEWAIFSDLYGVWFPEVKHGWYDKHPRKVTEYEFKELLKDFEQKLGKYEEIYFYHNPGRFHRLHKRLLGETKSKDKIIKFSHIREISMDNKMSESCKWLHEQLEQLPIIKFPFTIEQLPENGIYFFYENGEIWGHGGNKPRIVRIGTSKDGNFRSRIKEHYLLDESKMNFDKDKPKPSDRSIFRKHIGRALLNRHKDDYLQIWNIDFMKKENRKSLGHKRNIDKEKRIESKITRILRERFSFRFIMIDTQIERMGSKGLEKRLIGTIANCKLCKSSDNWLGKYAPKKQIKIKESGLWLVQHLKANGINENDKKLF